jgi:hypothetical protein
MMIIFLLMRQWDREIEFLIYGFGKTFRVEGMLPLGKFCTLFHFPAKFLRHRDSVPSSPLVASTVPVTFHATRHTGADVSMVSLDPGSYDRMPAFLIRVCTLKEGPRPAVAIRWYDRPMDGAQATSWTASG